MTLLRRTARIASALLLAAGLVACGDDDTSSPDTSAPGPDPEEPSSTTTSLPEELALCEVLAGEPFEVRRAALADAEGPVAEAAAGECRDDVRRVTAAVRVMETATALLPEHVEAGLPEGCGLDADGSFGGRLAVRGLDAPVSGRRDLGVAGTVRLLRSGEEVAGSVGEFFDFPDLSAGEQSPTWTQIAGRAPAGTDRSGLTCRLSARPYYDDRSNADAALDEPVDPSLADPDPAVWFPALVEAERAWRGSGDTDLVATTVDIRNSSYLDIVGDVASASNPFAGEISPCFISNVRGGKAEVTYASTVEGRTSVHYLVFRQGSDGGWRRLTDGALLGTDVGCDALGFLYQHRTHEPIG